MTATPKILTADNVEFLRIELDRAGFASTVVRDRTTGVVYVIPGGYVQVIPADDVEEVGGG